MAGCKSRCCLLSQKGGWPGRQARCPAACSCWTGRSLELGGLRSLRPGQAQRSWKLLIRLVSGTQSELTACGSSHHQGRDGWVDKNSPSVEGLDSATDLGSELSLNVPPGTGAVQGVGRLEFQPLLCPTCWMALVGPLPCSGPWSSTDCSEPQMEILRRVRELIS